MRSQPRLSRRALFKAGGLALASLAVSPMARGVEGRVDIHMQSDLMGADVGFDPIGLWVAPGTMIRWVLDANVHTTTAYHPRNDRHSLRIPPEAQPWDSGFLINPGDHFEVRLTVEGVYDYFCAPHEFAGMVGRIVVGRPSGPGLNPYDDFRTTPEGRGWKEVPPAAQAAFPAVESILRLRSVRRKPAPDAPGAMQGHRP